MQRPAVSFAVVLTIVFAGHALRAHANGGGSATAAMPEAGYKGALVAMNEKLGLSPKGSVSVRLEGSDLVIEVDAQGIPAGMHMMHVHGFPRADPGEARCPTPRADVNGDGYVDLIETEELAGITMVPLHREPTSLEIASQGYSRAGEADGSMTYRNRVEMQALTQAMKDKFDTPPALGQRVVFIHGVPETTSLPASVQSLPGVPAHMTIPIACAEL